MTSAQLLSWCETMSGLPSENEEMDSTKWYLLLSVAQEELFRILATHVPWSQYGDAELLTSSDGGYTYDLAHFPWGRVVIRESLQGRVLVPGAEHDSGADYAIEGQKIRLVNNTTRTFSAGPYARYCVEPTVISAVVEPTLKPDQVHVVIAWRALEMWATAGRLRNPSHYAREVQKVLWGDPQNRGEVGLIGALKVAYQFQDGPDGPSDYLPWHQQAEVSNGLM